jgi:hypothetical protein
VCREEISNTFVVRHTLAESWTIRTHRPRTESSVNMATSNNTPSSFVEFQWTARRLRLGKEARRRQDGSGTAGFVVGTSSDGMQELSIDLP